MWNRLRQMMGGQRRHQPAEHEPQLEQALSDRQTVLQRADAVLRDFYYADDLMAGRVRERRRVPRPR